ncbi:hypothetical protein M132_0471 [Bacteroides fragilis str. S24L15]|nr:hypothetical protein M132_0471 [Bacteroides fragilis str. S24L15]
MLFPQPAALFPDGDADGKLFVKTVSDILLGVEKSGGAFLKKTPPLFLPAGISGFASARLRIFFVPHAGESPFLV